MTTHDDLWKVIANIDKLYEFCGDGFNVKEGGSQNGFDKDFVVLVVIPSYL